MSTRWMREHRADLQITAYLLAGVALALGGGIGIGIHIAPPQVVEIRTTVTLAKPPVCVLANEAAGTVMSSWDAAEAEHERAIQLAEDQTEATYGRRQSELAQILEDAEEARGLEAAAISARDDARGIFNLHNAACDTWNAPQRVVERIAR